MKLRKVKNVSACRLVILSVRERDGQPLSFEPGECKQMMPATVSHPAVSAYIGRGLQLVEEQNFVEEVPKTKVLDTAFPPAPPPVPVVETPVIVPVEEAQVIQEAPATPASFIAHAPGITEENSPAIIAAFPTLADLAKANMNALVKVGLSKTGSRKLIAWAAAQLNSTSSVEFSDDDE